MRLRHLPLALALVAGTLATAPAAIASSSALAFDMAVADRQVTEFTLEHNGAVHRIAGLERLDVELEGPDGRPGAMYVARVDGRPATLVRLGDALDIAFDDAAPTSAAARSRRSGEWTADYTGFGDLVTSDDAEPYDPEADEPGGDGLNVWIFLHDQSKEPDHAHFLNWYTTWWVREMQKDIVPGKKVRVFLKTNVPGLTDLDYHAGTAAQRLKDVHLRGFEHVHDAHGAPGQLARYVLFVDEPAANWGEDVVGVALDNGKSALASRRGPRHIVAHEIGHTIGGVHELAQKAWCASSMAGYVWLTASCLWYTTPNQRGIRDYLLPRL
ncbi:hypothetical protein SAMN02800694_0667 [Luteibacter sp. UNCMF331Sha3.1]|uniref:reprolysin-like metallopeptidase n=1 Tax=Luteibacter sp. UNCMF331Sha3.1 TaxID=1502760 RepID=UPI0008B3BD92|nr:hypothetical protein [Luteibacter sp. UNCMF331Sha3.1]SEM33001.1 hypothetical protein SAMN02800694_0667 [Luteibacter sp. UNCMF331Sha3.1]